MNDLISVIVLVYRVEKYLEKCIESIINQTYKNLEIILVDDGSDDNCPKICDYYEKLDSRIKVIHKKNGGIDDARKAGIQEATGKYVGYVDGDDWIDLNMYEELLKLATENGVEIVESGVIDSWEDVEKKRVSYFEEGCYKGDKFDRIIGPKILYTGNFFQHGISPYLVTKLCLRDRLIEYQMLPEPSKNIVDDTMCTFPCILESRSLYVTHQCYYHYRVRNNSAKREIRTDISSIVRKCYSGWFGRFKGAKSTDYIDKQIKYFTLYLLISKAPFVFDNPFSKQYLVPYGQIEKNNKLVLYGAGAVGIHIKDYIDSVNGSQLIYWADKNFRHLSLSMNVGDPKKIIDYEYDYVIISILTQSAVESAKKDLINLGIPENKILWINHTYIHNPEKLLEIAKDDKGKIIAKI